MLSLIRGGKIMNYSLEVNNISKTLGKNLILDDINFKLEKGKIYGLVGANGSGKSTLLKIILGLYDSKGGVVINGYNLKYSFSDALRSVGGIVDFVSFYEYLTAYENLRYFALLYEVPVSRIDEVIKLVGLKKSEKTVKKFSLGMKQRLGLAIALLKNPSILILDEPTNGLDPKGILELRNLLLSFEDKTIIISSHIIAEIEKIVDEVLFINNKKLYQKTIGHSDGKSLVKIIVDDVEKAARILNKPQVREDKGIYMSDDEVAKSVKKLSTNDVSVYRVYDGSSLEDMLVSMIEGEDE